MSSELRPVDWWRSAVVYQVYPRSFQDSDGDGVGDIPGITSRLDHLVRLGVNVLWLSPVYASPMDDNGYDISDYRDVDPSFGTLRDLDALFAGCHERGIKVVMDLVVNHTSDEHAWFQESRDPSSPKRGWYWWRPAREGHQPGTEGAEPNNWESVFSGPAWEYDERSGEYYLHLFSRTQPDLDWENPEVREAVHDMMRWWVDRGVDGFRMDVINLISKDPALPDGQPRNGASTASAESSVANGPRLHEFLHEMNRAVGLSEHRLLTVGEMPGSTVELARDVTDPARGELNMVFTFEHVSLDQVPGAGKWDLRDLPLPVLKDNLDTGSGSRGDRLELALLGQPRPAACGVPLRRRQPAAPGGLGQDAGDGAAPAPRHAVRLPGRGVRHDERRLTDLADYRDIDSLNHYREAIARACSRGRARVAGGQGARQRPDADAVGRLRARRVHDRHAVAAGQPEHRRGSTPSALLPTRPRSSTTTGG